MRLDLFLILCSVCLLSCPSSNTKKSLDFSVKNKSSFVLTVINSKEEDQRIVPGLCFKFPKEDFPLTVAFGNYESPSTLTVPSHYIITGPKNWTLSNSPCKTEIL